MDEKFNKVKYDNDFKKKNYKRVTALIPLKEKEVIAKLESVESRSSYILELIKKDLEK